MSGGLLALLDDVAALAKVAAASLDEIGAQAVKAGSKTAGLVVDDTAVTPRYVVGFAADRELPIIGKIAWGSIKNKLLILLPAALLLSAFAPWIITPLLMIGGLYLCFEGYEKVHEMVAGHEDGHTELAAEARAGTGASTSSELEAERVAGAVRTDFILSAEIMAITLASITAPDLFTQAVVLLAVALLVTGGVYGLVAIIVKADDFGIWLAQRKGTLNQVIGRGLVAGMPAFLKVLSLVGTIAMLWVGGGILIHGLAQLGYPQLETTIYDFARATGGALPVLPGFFQWFVNAFAGSILGIVAGAITAIVWGVVQPMFKSAKA
jgi:uncharacterized protein